jgi:hypothetical protein
MFLLRDEVATVAGFFDKIITITSCHGAPIFSQPPYGFIRMEIDASVRKLPKALPGSKITQK